MRCLSSADAPRPSAKPRSSWRAAFITVGRPIFPSGRGGRVNGRSSRNLKVFAARPVTGLRAEHSSHRLRAHLLTRKLARKARRRRERPVRQFAWTFRWGFRRRGVDPSSGEARRRPRPVADPPFSQARLPFHNRATQEHGGGRSGQPLARRLRLPVAIGPAPRWPPDGLESRNFPVRAVAGSSYRTPRPCLRPAPQD